MRIRADPDPHHWFKKKTNMQPGLFSWDGCRRGIKAGVVAAVVRSTH